VTPTPRLDRWLASFCRLRQAGLTFREIGKVVGVSPSTIHRLCHGGAKVDPATQRALERLELVEAEKVPPKQEPATLLTGSS
jgi:transcriptional regulator with XRE-family HTH domain